MCRRYREAVAAGQVTLPAQGPGKLRIDLPWPSSEDDAVRLLDEAAWPGGVVQRFRALRPCVEALLEGYEGCSALHMQHSYRYGASFAGMLESDADGVGVWSTPDMTAVINVTNATIQPFVDLAEGEYGSRVTQDGHMLLAINCQWTSSRCLVEHDQYVVQRPHRDVGQLWDWGLRKRAAALIDDSAPPWETVYALKPVYTSRGRCGIVFCAFPGPWQLYGIAADEYVQGTPVEPGRLLLSKNDGTFARNEIIDALRNYRRA